MSNSQESLRGRLRNNWRLDPSVDFLNHGSFGACPVDVLEEQTALRTRLERQPVDFFVRQYAGLLDDARQELARFLGADPDGLVPVPNSTTGVNAVIRSFNLEAGDELLTTDQSYGACRNAFEFVARRSGVKVVVVPLPFPVSGPDEIVQRVVAAATAKTRLALVDHVTSPTGIVMPVERIIRALEERGIETIIDGAHAPGMLNLNLSELRPSYYVGNCHKWICSPKGAGFLWVRADLRESVRPVTISHGATDRRPGRSRFQDEFDWTGTADPTAFLSVPAALRIVGSMVKGGWDEVRARNHDLVLQGRNVLMQALNISAPAPDEMIGSLSALRLPDRTSSTLTSSGEDPLALSLLQTHQIEVPIVTWPTAPQRLVRISAQLYNDIAQYERLAVALTHELSI